MNSVTITPCEATPLLTPTALLTTATSLLTTVTPEGGIALPTRCVRWGDQGVTARNSVSSPLKGDATATRAKLDGGYRFRGELVPPPTGFTLKY